MNNLLRTVHAVLETDIKGYPLALDDSKGKKAFQLIRYATGKCISTRSDYTINTADPWYGYDTIAIEGSKGFIRLALTPLFNLLD